MIGVLTLVVIPARLRHRQGLAVAEPEYGR